MQMVYGKRGPMAVVHFELYHVRVRIMLMYLIGRLSLGVGGSFVCVLFVLTHRVSF